MAIDQVEKRRGVARQAAALAPTIMDTLYRFEALLSQRDNGGPGGTPLIFVDSDFTGVEGLGHIDAAMMDAVFTTIPILQNAFKAQHFDEVFEAMRP